MKDCGLTILMPCLNEERTIAACIAEAQGYLIRREVVGEVLFLHVEKALRDVRGAYPMLVRETAKRYLGRARYENREEDDGDAGLRRSKRSYAPCVILEKNTAALSL